MGERNSEDKDGGGKGEMSTIEKSSETERSGEQGRIEAENRVGKFEEVDRNMSRQ